MNLYLEEKDYLKVKNKKKKGLCLSEKSAVLIGVGREINLVFPQGEIKVKIKRRFYFKSKNIKVVIIWEII